MNYLNLLPFDIILHIHSFIITSYANTIIYAWRRYFLYKRFILDSAIYSPKFKSFNYHFDIYIVTSPYTTFYFNKLKNIISGNEFDFYIIYISYYNLAIAINDYEWISNIQNKYYLLNKNNCIQTAEKFKWDDIIDILQ